MVLVITPRRVIVKDGMVTFWYHIRHPKLEPYYCSSSVIRDYCHDARQDEDGNWHSYHDYWDITTHKFRDTLLNETSTSVRTKHFLLLKYR